MDNKFLFIIISICSLYAPMSYSMTLESDASSLQPSNSVTSSFDISGNIDSYKQEQLQIIIDGVTYSLNDASNLTGSDLSPGQKIKFNIEKSSIEELPRVTKVWIELEEK